ncbi:MULTISPECIES: dipeptide ABC transporter ATP-binding protein [unclassified Xanthobacter]|uniref:dipeptide ABC transporter ATP-binding protein n=1 Tax=unclassified Xanthobacter TaxID=2623496 RepID=UPI001EDF96DE|nr:MULTISPECIES: ABC transporter ATP-binding protein [unclassified Xanthobacter]
MTAFVDVRNLSVDFKTRNGLVHAVRDVSFTLDKGRTLGIVGESGSGKSVTSYSLMRILDAAGVIAGGAITFEGMDIGSASERAMRDIRGREISMIFQNPRAALNPIRKVGHQIEDVLRQHVQADAHNAREKAIEVLKQVRINNPEERYHSYPFELSGGMCQRIVIALALACKPQLLIADEPTTGLDVTTQKAVMDLVAELTRARGMAMILITHDLGLAATYCDHLIVMKSGEVVESAPALELFRNPQHAYTKKLLRATPHGTDSVRDLLPEDMRPAEPAAAPEPAAAKDRTPLLEVRNLVKEYPLKSARGGVFRAVGGISFSVGRGESVGLVGESGCGKSTTSSMVMRLLDPTSGTIRFDGTDIGEIPAGAFARSPYRGRLQMVFQDATDSLNPRFSARRSIADPLLQLGLKGGERLSGAALNARVEELATLCGLPHHLLDRFPHQLSGGQKARVGIARAIAVSPDLLVLDEPTAALDVSVQAVVLNLLVDLKEKLGMSYLFVSHDLAVVKLLCERVIVMKGGEIVEQGNCAKILEAPEHDYTKALLAAIPHPPI